MRTLNDWLAWQSSLNPRTVDLGLDRVAQVWSRVGPRDLGFPVITVGGTNGKGSCVALIEAMAQAGGYRTVCYSSPHLLNYNERIRIGGTEVGDADLCAAFERIEAARGETPLTYFEFGTLAALDLFVRAGPDLAILEVGLGGRLDAVNMIDADAAVVTTVGHDHQDWLGGTLDAIAAEKAGIFRARRPAIIGQPDAPPRLRQEAERLGARVLQVGQEVGVIPGLGGDWTWMGPEGQGWALPPPAMRGRFQYQNAAAAIAALRACLPIPVNAIRVGLTRARLLGRFQVVPGEVTWILDVAHNREAAQALAGNLAVFPCSGRRRAVLALLADKDPAEVAGPLARLIDSWYLGQGTDPRAMSAAHLAERLSGALPESERRPFSDLSGAFEAALDASSPGDCVVVFGSFTTVEAALRRLGRSASAGILAIEP